MGFLDKYKQKRQARIPATPETPPDIVAAKLRAELIAERFSHARYGTECRSFAFYTGMSAAGPLGGGMDEYEYLLARALDEKAGRWMVYRVREAVRESLLDGAAPTLDHTLLWHDLPFFQMIEKMAEQETGWLAQERPRAEDKEIHPAHANAPHFIPFAENEGILFKTDRMPEPSLDGRVVIPGQYQASVVTVREQIDKAKQIREDWNQAIIELTGQALNSKAPFDLIMNTRAELTRYEALVKGFRERITAIDSCLTNKDYLSFDFDERYDSYSRYSYNRRSRSEAREDETQIRRAKYDQAAGIIRALPKGEVRSELERANNLISLIDRLGYVKVFVKKTHGADLTKHANEITRYADMCGYGDKDVQRFRAFLLTDDPVKIPQGLYTLVEELEKFIEKQKQWQATMEQELLQPDFETGRAKLQEYTQSRRVDALSREMSAMSIEQRLWELQIPPKVDAPALEAPEKPQDTLQKPDRKAPPAPTIRGPN